MDIEGVVALLEQHAEDSRENSKLLKSNMGEVLQEAKKTNGRVKSLEKWKFGLTMAWGLSTILIPVMFFLYTQNLNLQYSNLKYEIREEIDKKIEMAMSKLQR